MRCVDIRHVTKCLMAGDDVLYRKRIFHDE